MQGSNCQGHACSQDREVPVGCSGTVLTLRAVHCGPEAPVEGLLPSFLPRSMDILGTRGASCGWYSFSSLSAWRESDCGERSPSTNGRASGFGGAPLSAGLWGTSRLSCDPLDTCVHPACYTETHKNMVTNLGIYDRCNKQMTRCPMLTTYQALF